MEHRIVYSIIPTQIEMKLSSITDPTTRGASHVFRYVEASPDLVSHTPLTYSQEAKHVDGGSSSGRAGHAPGGHSGHEQWRQHGARIGGKEVTRDANSHVVRSNY
jgi:hypothetical protein